MDKTKTIVWIKEHKTELIKMGVAFAGTVTGTVIVAKKWKAISNLLKTTKPNISELAKPDFVQAEMSASTLSKDVIDNLSGITLTARSLGAKVGRSAQEINKRIVKAGLSKKLPCGQYILTELGRSIGTDTVKATKADYVFSNLEWDKKILEVLFTPNELLNIAEERGLTVADLLA